MKRVLVCDDDVTISEVVAIILLDSELAEVYTLPDCDNIIERVEAIKPAVILMDHRIPSQGGIIATQTIKNHPTHQNIPVVYFTASDDIISLAETAGADFMLAKPFTTKQLEDIVNKSISHRYD